MFIFVNTVGNMWKVGHILPRNGLYFTTLSVVRSGSETYKTSPASAKMIKNNNFFEILYLMSSKLFSVEHRPAQILIVHAGNLIL